MLISIFKESEKDHYLNSLWRVKHFLNVSDGGSFYGVHKIEGRLVTEFLLNT